MPRVATIMAAVAVGMLLLVTMRFSTGFFWSGPAEKGRTVKDREVAWLGNGEIEVVCLGDTHGRHREIEVPDGDILIYTGDCVNPHDVTDVEDQVKDFNAWLGDLQHPHKIFVAGNHDAERGFFLSDLRKHITNAVYLEDQEVTVYAGPKQEAVTIYGSPWQPQWPGFDTYKPAGPDLATIFQKTPRNVDILATHSPPLNQFDKDPEGKPIGSKDLLNVVDDRHPLLHCFGHVHAGRTRDMMSSQEINRRSSTTFVNGAICNDDLEVAWEPVKILM